MDSWDDSRLIAESLKGQSQAFGVLVRRYQDRLYNTVYRLTAHSEDAQDVVQEAFISAYQSLGSFKGDSLFFTWLYRIAMNAAISQKRKKKATISLETGSKHDLVIDPLDESVNSRPGEALERVEEERQLQKALQQLSAEHRAVIVLKDIDDLRYEEIAEILAVPIGTIRSRLHRARLELRDLMLAGESQKSSPEV